MLDKALNPFAKKKPNIAPLTDSHTLGIVAAGGKLVVPLKFLTEMSIAGAADLQIRPCLQTGISNQHDVSGDNSQHDAFVFHEWSHATTESSIKLDINHLSTSSTCGLACRHRQQAPERLTEAVPHAINKRASMPRELRASDLATTTCFVAAVVERQPLAGAGASECEWTIRLQPPLLVHNQLPMPASYCIFEGGRHNVKQHGVVDAGGVVAIHAVHQQRTIGCTFVPEGWQKHDDMSACNTLALTGNTQPIQAAEGAGCSISVFAPLAAMPWRQLLVEHSTCAHGSAAAGLSEGAAHETECSCSALVQIYAPCWIANYTNRRVDACLVSRGRAEHNASAQKQRRRHRPRIKNIFRKKKRHPNGRHDSAGLQLDAGVAADETADIADTNLVDCTAELPVDPDEASLLHCVQPGHCHLLCSAALTSDPGGALLQLCIDGASWSPGLDFFGLDDSVAASTGSQGTSQTAQLGSALRQGKHVLLRADAGSDGGQYIVAVQMQVRSHSGVSLCRRMHSDVIIDTVVYKLCTAGHTCAHLQ